MRDTPAHGPREGSAQEEDSRPQTRSECNSFHYGLQDTGHERSLRTSQRPCPAQSRSRWVSDPERRVLPRFPLRPSGTRHGRGGARARPQVCSAATAKAVCSRSHRSGPKHLKAPGGLQETAWRRASPAQVPLNPTTPWASASVKVPGPAV